VRRIGIAPSCAWSLIRSERETADGSFDWFKSYSEISSLLKEYIPEKNARILMLGCGNSKLSEDVTYPLATPND
jgi:hypothetical protein